MTPEGVFSWSHIGLPREVTRAIARAGVDRVEMDEFQRTIDVAGDRFLERIFTPAEMAFCANRVDRLATRFAAKEAVSKVLGTGFRGLGWREVEVLTTRNGEPRLALHDRARNRAEYLGMTSIGVSLTHTNIAAEAFVVALCTRTVAEQWVREEISHGCGEA